MIQDIKAIQSNIGQYDFEIDPETKDLASVEGFESAVSVQLDTDQRANREERSDAQNRQGWIGDIYNEGYQIGSKMHLKQQARDTSKNEIVAEAKISLEYLVRIGAAKEITAAFLGNTIDGKIIIDANNVNRYNRLWSVTGAD
jgi:phage gp46-like protein